MSELVRKSSYIEIEPCNLAVMVAWLRQMNPHIVKPDDHVFMCKDGSWEVREGTPEVPEPSPYLAALGSVAYVLEETADLPDMGTGETSWHGETRYSTD